MAGNLANFFAIIIGSAIGLFLKNFNMEKYNDTIIKGMALCVMVLGIQGAIDEPNVLLMIMSIAIGGLLGGIIGIDEKLNDFGSFLDRKLNFKGSKVSKGFVTATLIYCVGAMGILGALDIGISGDHQKLFAKSILDGVSAIAFASTMGVGVLLSAFPVLIYQGLITIFAVFIKDFLTFDVIHAISNVGSVLILGISFNVLEITKIKIGDLLPAILIPVIYYGFIVNLF
ncbi:DUF554 domain-containing protein [Peptostreptococcaceae bacterium AGR-M142]